MIKNNILNDRIFRRTHFNELTIYDDDYRKLTDNFKNLFKLDEIYSYQGIDYKIISIHTPDENFNNAPNEWTFVTEQMSGNKIQDDWFVKDVKDKKINYDEPNHLYFACDPENKYLVNIVSNGSPYYDQTFYQMSMLYNNHPNSTFVECRLGFSKLLYIEKVKINKQFKKINIVIKDKVIPDITSNNWMITLNKPGETVKENHNVVVPRFETYTNTTLNKFDDWRIREVNSTHEFYHNIKIESRDDEINSEIDEWMIYPAKGMNVIRNFENSNEIIKICYSNLGR